MISQTTNYIHNTRTGTYVCSVFLNRFPTCFVCFILFTGVRGNSSLLMMFVQLVRRLIFLIDSLFPFLAVLIHIKIRVFTRIINQNLRKYDFIYDSDTL